MHADRHCDDNHRCADYSFVLETLVGMFVSGESSQVERVFADAQTYLFTIIIFYLPLLCVNVYRNVLQGMGEALVPLIGGVMELSMRVLVAVFAVNLRFSRGVPCQPHGLGGSCRRFGACILCAYPAPVQDAENV